MSETALQCKRQYLIVGIPNFDTGYPGLDSSVMRVDIGEV